MCVQKCATEGQHHDQSTGQCICAHKEPDVRCPAPLFCNDRMLCEVDAGDTPFDQWMQSPMHKLLLSAGAVALVCAAACGIMQVQDRRQRRREFANQRVFGSVEYEPAEPLWPGGAE